LSAQEKTQSGTGYEYSNTIGVRLGETSGISYKHIFDKGNAFEGIISFWPYTVGATGLYEKHLQTLVPGLRWYFGGGGHFNIGGYRRTYYRYHGDYNTAYTYHSNAFAAGVDGIIGVEYKFKWIPLALSTDIKPYTEINNYGTVNMAIDPGIGVKFTY
jgi:hypothetical protein